MGGDPNQPGYDPTYDGGSTSAGSGDGFGADVYALYKAGRVKMPELAQRYSTSVSSVHQIQADVSRQSSAAGNPSALTKLLGLRDDLHFAMRKTTIALRDTGTALVKIADDYVTSDQEALTKFNELMGEDTETDYSEKTPSIPDPPNVNDPHPNETGPPRPMGGPTPY